MSLSRRGELKEFPLTCFLSFLRVGGFNKKKETIEMARQYSKQFKLECADSIIEGSATLKGLAKENNMNPNVLTTWVAKRKSGNMKNWIKESEGKKEDDYLPVKTRSKPTLVQGIKVNMDLDAVVIPNCSSFTMTQIDALECEIARLHKEQNRLQSAIDALKASY